MAVFWPGCGGQERPPVSLIGMTTSVPIEVILAAGQTPVDLNNLFITDPDPYSLVAEAEAEGFARSLCSWIKGQTLRLVIDKACCLSTRLPAMAKLNPSICFCEKAPILRPQHAKAIQH